MNEQTQSLTFVVDIDGTLCPIKQKEKKYEDLIPYPAVLEKLREYRAAGARIILYTARNMNSYGGNLGLINANTAKILLKWLDQWEIPYDEIIYGKPWPGQMGFYVDDRAIRPDEFVKLSMKEMQQLCDSSRKGLTT